MKTRGYVDLVSIFTIKKHYIYSENYLFNKSFYSLFVKQNNVVYASNTSHKLTCQFVHKFQDGRKKRQREIRFFNFHISDFPELSVLGNLWALRPHGCCKADLVTNYLPLICLKLFTGFQENRSCAFRSYFCSSVFPVRFIMMLDN